MKHNLHPKLCANKQVKKKKQKKKPYTLYTVTTNSCQNYESVISEMIHDLI